MVVTPEIESGVDFSVVKNLLLAVLFFAAIAFGQESADPSKQLGTTCEQFRLSYPEDCRTLRAARYANETKKGSLRACEVKHDGQSIIL